MLSKKDKNVVIDRYSERFEKFGHSPLTLGWNKGKQSIRFNAITSQFDLDGKSLLDVGCGFGDLFAYLSAQDQQFNYTGIDLVEKLIEQGKATYSESENLLLECGDFLEMDVSENQYDYVVGSGIFNFKLEDGQNYSYIENTLRKAFRSAKEGISFDFLSDKVDFTYEHTFHSSPERILSLCYDLSKNVTLRNDIMPFEFTVTVHKDDSFSKEDTLFNRYKEMHK